MDHDRYGLDGMPLSCRGADCDPVTGISFPRVRGKSSTGIPHLRVILAGLMLAFIGFFAWQTHLLG
ncbi:hypothetical protein [Sphingobium indicum]|uniref:hypothetical protein n=1 Tax=Sphingobium indicum TaxID=332055 RepID=UPI001E4A5509|nr:hypothetical protein [Sphingobium indicum]